MAENETGWTKEFPKEDGYYWWAISGEVRLLEVILNQREAWTQGDADNQWDKAYYWTGKFLGPISPADLEQLTRLREVADKAAGWIETQTWPCQHSDMPMRCTRCATRAKAKDLVAALREALAPGHTGGEKS